MKKIYGLILVVITALFLVACNGENAVKVTVTFETNGGTPAIESKEYNIGSLVEAPVTITKDGFTFEFWANGETEWKFAEDRLTTDLTLSAIWKEAGDVTEEKVTVTFDSQGGSAVNAVELNKGAKVVAPANPTKAGFEFKEWQLNGVKFDFNQAVEANITLDAVWTEEVVVTEKVTITFDSQGGSAVASLEITKGSVVSAPAHPTKAGFDFMGWTVEGVNFDFGQTILENITLVAKWEEVEQGESALAHKFDMSVLPDGQTSYVSSPTEFDILDSVTNSNISLTRENANFSIPNGAQNRAVVLGLRSGNSWNSAYLRNTNAIDNITSVKIDYAVWGDVGKQNLEYAKGVYVQSSVDGTTWVNELDLKTKFLEQSFYTSSETVDFAAPAKFVRIFVESVGQQSTNFQMRLIINGLEIYTGSGSATPVEQVTVTFDSNHGNNTPVQVKVNEGRLVSSINPVARTGYKFLGWFDGETLYDFNQTVNENLNLVAKWEVVENPVDPVDPVEPGDTELELAHEYLFNKVATDQSYVTAPTAIDINNGVAGGSKVGFERLNTAFNAYNSTQGAVLAIRYKNNYESAYLATTSAVEGLSAIEFNYTVWGNQGQQNLSHAKGIYIETSTDGINWTVEKDIKGEIVDQTAFEGVAKVEGLSGDLYVRIHAESAIVGAASQFDMRIIIEELRFYINGVPFTGTTYQATLDLAYEGAAAPSVINVREGNKLSKPSNPSRLGHTFLGWYAVGTDVEFDFNQTINENVRLFAKWEVKEAEENPSDGDANIAAYYSRLSSLSGSALESEIRNMIKTMGRASGSTNEVKAADTYQGKNYNIYDGFGGYGNREHVWPNSKLGSAPKYDLHNLRAAVVSTNSKRSNHPFGEGSGGWSSTGSSFYPGDEHVGDVARIVLYIHTRYNLSITLVGNMDMFLRWHAQDPVSDFERVRNNNIQGIVGSRNPFIDYPEYVELLFGAPRNVAAFDITTANQVDLALPVYGNRNQFVA